MQLWFEDGWWPATPEWQDSGLFARFLPSKGFKTGSKVKISLARLHELIKTKTIKGDADGELEELIAQLQVHALPDVLPSRRSGSVSRSVFATTAIPPAPSMFPYMVIMSTFCAGIIDRHFPPVSASSTRQPSPAPSFTKRNRIIFRTNF